MFRFWTRQLRSDQEADSSELLQPGHGRLNADHHRVIAVRLAVHRGQALWQLRLCRPHQCMGHSLEFWRSLPCPFAHPHLQCELGRQWLFQGGGAGGSRVWSRRNLRRNGRNKATSELRVRRGAPRQTPGSSAQSQHGQNRCVLRFESNPRPKNRRSRPWVALDVHARSATARVHAHAFSSPPSSSPTRDVHVVNEQTKKRGNKNTGAHAGR